MTSIVDAHHHLWDPATRAYPWMAAAELEPIRHRFDLDDLRAHAAVAGIDATVLVQTVSEMGETSEFLTTAAEAGDLIAGVVGWVDLTSPDVADALATLAAGAGGDRLVGVRHQVEDEPDPMWLLRRDVSRGLSAVSATGLVYDLLVPAGALPHAIATVDDHPTLSFVLDHAAKPPIAAGNLAGWCRDIAELAARDNVTVKLSGLVTEADWRSWALDDLRPVVDQLLATFGPQRLMFGSDWPVCELAATYEQVVATATALLSDLTQPEREVVLGGTARRVYGLALWR